LSYFYDSFYENRNVKIQTSSDFKNVNRI